MNDQVVKEGEVLISIDCLQDVVDILEGTVNELLPRLDIVSRPEQPRPTAEKKREDVCRMSTKIFESVDKIQSIIDTIDNKKKDLEI